MRDIPMPEMPEERAASIDDLTRNPGSEIQWIRNGRPKTWDTAQCPQCGAATDVKDSRLVISYGPRMVRRRRECGGCGYKFSTIEVNALLLVDFLDIRHESLPSIATHLRALADRIEKAAR